MVSGLKKASRAPKGQLVRLAHWGLLGLRVIQEALRGLGDLPEPQGLQDL